MVTCSCLTGMNSAIGQDWEHIKQKQNTCFLDQCQFYLVKILLNNGNLLCLNRMVVQTLLIGYLPVLLSHPSSGKLSPAGKLSLSILAPPLSFYMFEVEKSEVYLCSHCYHTDNCLLILTRKYIILKANTNLAWYFSAWYKSISLL